MHPNIMITGTDTDVGKTFVSCALLVALRQRGMSINALKPLETGGVEGCPGPDALSLAQALGISGMDTFWRSFSGALAPLQAAKLANQRISTELLEAQCREKMAAAELTLIEGAGGILVPIAPNYRYLELAQALKIPVLLVAANRLGVINHTLLSVEVLKNAGVPVLGIVLNNLDGKKPSLAQSSNQQVLEGCLGDTPIVCSGYKGRQPSHQTWAELGEHILTSLFDSSC